MEVASLVLKGWTEAAIANGLFVSRATVATHLQNIMAKVGVETREALEARLRAEGLH
jgi:DNA-binding NarL/FixJ family response regulator